MDGRGRSVRGPVVLTVIGGVLIVVGIVLWVIAFGQVDEAATEVVDEGLEVRQDLLAEMDVPGAAEVDLPVGTWSVYAIEVGGFGDPTTTSAQSTELPPSTPTTGPDAFGGLLELTVSVTGPDGAPVLVDTLPNPTVFPDFGGGDVLYETATFSTTVAGSYTVEVESAPGAPPATLAGVGREIDLGDALEQGLTGAALFGLGLLTGGVGFVIVIIGVIWLAVASSPRRRPPPPGPWPPPGAWQQPPAGSWQQPPPGW